MFEFLIAMHIYMYICYIENFHVDVDERFSIFSVFFFFFGFFLWDNQLRENICMSFDTFKCYDKRVEHFDI